MTSRNSFKIRKSLPSVILMLLVATLFALNFLSKHNSQPDHDVFPVEQVIEPYETVEVSVVEPEMVGNYYLLTSNNTLREDRYFQWASQDESTFVVYETTQLPTWVNKSCVKFSEDYHIHLDVCQLAYSISLQSHEGDTVLVTPQMLMALSAILVNDCYNNCPVGPGGTYGPWQIYVVPQGTDLFDKYGPWPNADINDPVVSGLTAANIVIATQLEMNLYRQNDSSFVLDFMDHWDNNRSQAQKAFSYANNMLVIMNHFASQ